MGHSFEAVQMALEITHRETMELFQGPQMPIENHIHQLRAFSASYNVAGGTKGGSMDPSPT